MHPTLVFLKVLKPYYSKRLMRFGSRGPKRHRKALTPKGLGRRLYKDGTTVGHFRYIRIHHKNKF